MLLSPRAGTGRDGLTFPAGNPVRRGFFRTCAGISAETLRKDLQGLIDVGLGVSEGEETGFVGTGGEVDPAFEAGPEELLEGLEVSLLHRVDVDDFSLSE